MEERPRIGIGVVVFKEGKVLLGKRIATYGTGEYQTPGGHLEWKESFEACARREVLEESGLEIENIRFLCLANVMSPPKHCVHIGLAADWKSGEPENREPDKCEGWGWYPLDNLPEPILIHTKLGLEAHRNGQVYRDGA